eukprot:CAMPEP_0206464660 /NCGR_PEP_ID=MMETSP0324_2-20121206/27346_1 /ASSEMBLY_ACC=CAM_ASM_000836 /TAXON_ID=2866 /ORGANISM="Crypthecodinium cohnii, Strain Seligo" /LENGTH=37 /DNA_ID= /DNA_START= /DNA_END= /DNA_ORIENTATION=
MMGSLSSSLMFDGSILLLVLGGLVVAELVAGLAGGDH